MDPNPEAGKSAKTDLVHPSEFFTAREQAGRVRNGRAKIGRREEN